jgi:MtN3 and saliva related transmembrane protein
MSLPEALSFFSVDVIGYCAASMTTLSFVPQVIQTLRTRDLSGISLLMYAVFCAGLSLWLIYGIMLLSLPLIISNTCTLILAGIILWLKIRQVFAEKRTLNITDYG